MKPRPVVSVIIAAFNAEAYIVKAITSVLDQTMSQLEVIVVDDCSTDDTLHRVQSIQDERVQWYSQAWNQGPSFCRNYAIERAQGDWIAILDSDDWWDPTRLEVLLRRGIQGDFDVVCDDLYLVEDETCSPKNTYLKSRETVIGKVTKTMIITPLMMIHDDYGVLQPLIRTDFLRENSVRYRVGHRFGEDFVFLLDCLMAEARMVLYPVPYYYYRLGHVSSSTSAENPLGQCTMLEHLISSPPYNGMPQISEALQQKLKKKRLIADELRAKRLFHEKEFMKGVAAVLQHPMLLVGYARAVKSKVLSFHGTSWADKTVH